MLQINKLLVSLVLSSFLLACDPITPDPLVSSPDKELTDSVAVSAQVATGEQVAYTYTAFNNSITEVNVRRKEGSDPKVIVCEIVDCPDPGIGAVFPDTNNVFDGSIVWHTVLSETLLNIYVGGGDESKYSITASDLETSKGVILTAEDTYGVIKANESVEYSLAVTGGAEYTITLNIALDTDSQAVGSISKLDVCLDAGCSSGVDGTFVPTSYPATYTYTAGADITILYLLAYSAENTVFSIKAEVTP